jgi:hypothetical protein
MAARAGLFGTERPDVSSKVGVGDRKRRANDLMRAGLQRYDASEPIPFFCECDREPCYHPVWLTRDRYDSLRSNMRWRPMAEGEHGADTRSLAGPFS